LRVEVGEEKIQAAALLVRLGAGRWRADEAATSISQAVVAFFVVVVLMRASLDFGVEDEPYKWALLAIQRR
jgi:hypothetical protein